MTSANAGLGYETTLALAKKEAHVVMACRSASKAERTKQEVLKKALHAKLEILILDLSSLRSVRAFADNFLKTHQRLDALVNNACAMIASRGFKSHIKGKDISSRN